MSKSNHKTIVKKNYLKMSLKELREATKQYDAENLNPTGKPVPRKVQAAHDRAMKSIRRKRA